MASKSCTTSSTVSMRRRNRSCSSPAGTSNLSGTSSYTERSCLEWTRTYVRTSIGPVQLRLDAADRLVELVEERRGPVAADDAARAVLRLGRALPVGLARSLLDEAVCADARLQWAGDLVALAGAPGEALTLEDATFVVFDLET